MLKNSKLRALVVLLIATLLSGCGAIRDHQIRAQANKLGKAQAGLNLPEVPAICKKRVPHAALTEGEELSVLLGRERAQLDKANNRLIDCAHHNEQLKTNLEAQE